MKNLDIYWGYRVTHFLYLLIYLTLTLTFLYLIYHNKTLLFIVTIFFILFFPFFHTWVKEHTKENLYKTNYAYLKELSLLSVEIMNSNLFSKKEIARQSFGKLGNILNINMIALFLEDDLGFGYKQIIINNFNFMKKNIDFINNQAPLISLIKLKKIYFTKQELLTYAEIDSFNIMADLDASFVFPIFIGEVLYGVLFLGNKIKNKENFTDEDLKMVKNVIKSTEKTLLRCKKTQQQYSGHNKLTQTSNIEFIASLKRLIKTNNINELTNNIISLLLRNFHSEYASFYVYSIEKKGYYNAITNANFIPKQSDFIKILHAKEEILNFRHVSFMTDKYSEDSYAILKNTMVMLKANLIVPIVMNSLLGFIVLGKETSDYSSNDMFKINFIAHTLSMTLQDIVYACNINQATEVYNKIYFNNSLEEGMIRSFKTKKALSLMFLKTDTSLGKELKPLIRISDILCKYSEERFVVILPETKNTIVKKVAKRIEDNFSSLGISVVAGFDTLDPKQYHSFNIGMLYSIKEKLINTAILRTKR
ncbi:MAG: diguanylate cyclase [Bacteroidetes bacterium]|nr:diguanylate cyclase [Bacteroidota bacterium]